MKYATKKTVCEILLEELTSEDRNEVINRVRKKKNEIKGLRIKLNFSEELKTENKKNDIK